MTNADPEALSDPQTLNLSILKDPNSTSEQVLANAAITETFSTANDPRGDTYTLTLDQPVALERGTHRQQKPSLQIELEDRVLPTNITAHHYNFNEHGNK